jgi:hypothetical protein
MIAIELQGRLGNVTCIPRKTIKWYLENPVHRCLEKFTDIP